MDKDLSSAKALYEQMQQEGIHIDELSLKRLAVLYRDAQELVPFSEPPVSHTQRHTSPGFITDNENNKKSNSDHTMLSQSTVIEKDWAGGFYFGTQRMIIFSVDLQKIPELISCGCEMQLSI